MKVAFLSAYDPLSTSSWSGTPYYMLKALSKRNISIEILGPVNSYMIYMLKVYKLILRCFGKEYDYSHSKLLSRYYGRIFGRKLKKIDGLDFIIAPAGSSQIAFLKTTIPIIYLSDTTYDQLKSYYPNLNKKTIINDEDASLIERKAIEKATVVSFPSKWAMDFCRNYYRLDFDKLVEIPWGANLFDDIHFASKNIIQKNSYTCLFLGVDWERKGGKTALKAIEYVRQLYGIDVRLKICGCTPNQKILPTWVELIDKVDKNNVDEYQKFIDVLSNADILLLPTIAECYGMVFCEAAAFGLPVVATDTGGVSSIVINERTGILIKDPLDYKHFGNAIHKIISSVETYQNYSQNARIRYNNILHWDNWAKKIIEIMYEHKNRRIK